MAKNQLDVQVTFTGDLEQLKKIGGALNQITATGSKAYTQEIQDRAKKLQEINANLLEQFAKDSAKGTMSQKQVDEYRAAFTTIAKDASNLAKDIRKATKDFRVEDIISQEEMTKLDSNIEKAKKKLEELKSKEVTGTDGTLVSLLGDTAATEISAQLKLGSITKLGAAYKNINNQLTELETLEEKATGVKGIDELTKTEQKRLVVLRERKNLLEETKNKVGEAITEEEKNNKLIEKAEENYKKAKRAKDNYYAKKRQEVMGPVVDQGADLNAAANAIIENNSIVKMQKFVKDLGVETNILSNFTSTAKEKFGQFTKSLLSGVLIFQGLKKVARETINTIRDLDRAFNEIAMVTTYTTKEVWNMKNAFSEIARTTGLTIVEVTKLAGEFFRQGRSYSEVIALTEAAGVAANIAGISATESVNYLTSAINGYQLSANQAMMVSDKFAALAAASATDYEELAIALSKVAAQAYSAGVGMDSMMAFIAKALETTREAPENIGTAFKTIFARMQELKDFGKTLEEGMDVNRVDKALGTIGVTLTDNNNELRNLDEILIDVGNKWKDLSKNQKAYIATALAGTRQQTRLLAVFEDFDRTMELVEISSNSLGASYSQQEKYTNSIAFALNKLTVAWQDFVSSLGSSDLIIFIVNTFTHFINTINNLIKAFGPLGPVITILGIALTGLAMQAIGVATAVKTTALNMVAASGGVMTYKTALENANAALGKSIIAQGLKAASDVVTSASSFTLATAFTAVGAAAQTMTKAMLASPLFPVIATIAAVTAAVAALGWALDAVVNKNKNYVESSRKMQASIYNFRKEADELEKLAQRYEELDSSINLTTADLEEQRSIAQQIQDLVGEDVNVLSIEGELDLTKVKQAIQDNNNNAEKTFNEMINKSMATYGSLSKAYTETLDQSTKDAIILQKIIQEGDPESYDAFIKLEKSKRDELKATAQLQLDLDKNIKKVELTGYLTDKGQADQFIAQQKRYYETLGFESGDAYSNALQEAASQGLVEINIETKFNEDEINLATEKLQQLFNVNFSQLGLKDQINQLTKLSYDTWGTDVQEAIGKVIPEVRSLTNLMNQLGEISASALGKIIANSNLSSEQIYKLGDAITNLGLTTENQGILLKNVLQAGEDTFGGIQKYAEETNTGFFEMLDIVQSISDAMSNVSLESLTNEITSIRSLNTNLEKVNKILNGEEDYDLAFMDQMIQMYPEIATAITENRELSISEMNDINDVAEVMFNANIDRQIASLQTEIDNNNLKISAYENMLNYEAELNKELAEMGIEVEVATLEDYEKAWDNYLNKKVENNLDANFTITKSNYDSMVAMGTMTRKQADDAIASLNKVYSAEKNLIPGEEDLGAQTIKTFSERISDAIKTLKDNNETLQRQITNYTYLKNNIEKITATTKAATETTKEYTAALNELYVLEQQLAMIQNELDYQKILQDNADTGEQWLTAIHSQNKALTIQNDTLNSTIDAQKRNQQALYDSLGNIQNSVRLVNGRMIPVMSEYIKLTGEQQEIVDSAVESYNDLTEGIVDNSAALLENEATIKANLQAIEDKTVEFYDTIADAIRENEKDRLETLQAGWEEERKLIDKRKAAYEAAFSEEDYTNSLEEQSKRREELILEIAKLEGATDNASLKKKAELISEKETLDQEYNQTITDYNREALYKSLENQQESIDSTENAYETAYEERINSTEWLESEINRIMSDGLDATIAYLKENLPEYENAWSISKDNIEDEWTMLFGIVDTTIEEIQNKIPDFSGMIAQIKEAIGELNTLTGINTPPQTTASPNIVPSKESPPVVTKAPVYSYKTEWGSWSEVSRTSSTVTYRRYEYTITYKDGVGINSSPTGKKQERTERTYSNGVVVGVAGGGPQEFATGGLADYTGLAMLHGSPSKPERVLSSVQTELFDKMVSNLEKLTFAPSSASNISESINIENITIQTPQLNSSLDFASAGRSLAAELKNAINERGLNINKKR